MVIQKMMRVWVFMTTVIFLLAGYPAGAKEMYKGVDKKGTAGQVSQKQKERFNVNKIEGDVAEAVKTILLLWKEGKYDLLYDSGDMKSRLAMSKEEFEGRMREKGVGLASSWEAIRDITVEVKSATLAYATAKVGYKSIHGGETKFRTEIYRMTLEDGMWKINLTKILQARM
jgi:hypothetical protein